MASLTPTFDSITDSKLILQDRLKAIQYGHDAIHQQWIADLWWDFVALELRPSGKMWSPAELSFLASKLVQSLGTELSDPIGIRWLTCQIFNHQSFHEHHKTLWRRMVHHITPEHRKDCKAELVRRGWQL